MITIRSNLQVERLVNGEFNGKINHYPDQKHTDKSEDFAFFIFFVRVPHSDDTNDGIGQYGQKRCGIKAQPGKSRRIHAQKGNVVP